MTTSNNGIDCPNGSSSCPIYSELGELKEKVEQLSDQVRCDFLTGLFNKQHLIFSLEQELERTARSYQATSLILIDADHFKSVNDTHGHVVGDKVLVQLANIIKDTVRKIDVPCRYGGEEFAVILPSSPVLTGTQVAERIRSKVEETPFVISDTLTLDITVSIGIYAAEHTQNLNYESVIEKADEQLYLAKKNGRNKVQHFVSDKFEPALVSTEEKDALFSLVSAPPKK